MNTYTFNDVLIKPQYSEITSRSLVDLSTKIGNHTFDFPIISANMRTITEATMAREMAKRGGLGILHRFNSINENVDLYKQTIEPEINLMTGKETSFNVGVSIGVQEEDKKRFELLYNSGARIFTIDIAHGWSIKMKNMLKWVNDQLFLWARNERSKITIIAGNIATGDAYFDLTDWGADVVKVGIGPGSGCTTRFNTGVGIPQLGALEEIYNQRDKQIAFDRQPSIIADGGVKSVGDIAKALKFADMVMVGGFISGTAETPGNVYKNPDGQFYKVYGGSASAENKGENKFVEGLTKTVPFRGKVKYILKEIREGLQSSCSYVGAQNLQEFKEKCEFVHISGNASRESKF